MADLKAVIFDIDGTLVEFKYDAEEVRKRVMTFIICQGIPEELLTMGEHLGDSIELIKAFLLKEKRMDDLRVLKDGVEKIMFKYEMRAVKSTRLLDGADDVLRKLKDMGLRLTAFTNAGSTSVNYLMNKFHLDNHFEFVVTRDECGAMKPAPDGVNQTVKRLGLEKDEVVMVGDSSLDILSAKNADVIPVGVASGARSAPDLRDVGAKYVLNSVVELPALLENLQKGKEPPTMIGKPDNVALKGNGAVDL